MKMKMRTIAAVSAALVGLSVLAAADDCTWDLKAISKARFEKDDPANPNIVKTPFGFVRETAMIFDGKVDVLCTDARVAAAMKAEREEGLFAMLSPESLIGLEGVRTEWLHNFAGMKVSLPDDKGGAYEVRFRYRSNHPRPGYGNASYSAYLNFADSEGKTFFRLNIPDSGDDSDYWFTREKVVQIPAGVKDLHLRLRLDGVGYLKVTGLSLKRAIVADEPDVSFVVKPYGWIDDRFAVEEGRVGALDVCWKKSKASTFKDFKCFVEYVIPKGFAFLGLNIREKRAALKVEPQADGTTRVFSPMGSRIRPWVGGFNDGMGMGLLVRALGAVGTEGVLKVRAVAEDGVTTLGEPAAITLCTVPRISVRKPKRYLAGAMLTYDFQFFRSNPEANVAYADFLVEKGVDWIMPQADWMCEDPTLAPMWRKRFRYVTSTQHDYLMNAYKIRGTGDRPKEDRFVPRPGVRESWDFKWSTCPAAVYEERPYFVTNVMPHLVQCNQGADGQWVNWEPFYFRGCYCDACKAKHVEWKKTDPNVEHFHAWQHGELVKTVHRYMKRDFNPGGIGLMPAIAWCELGSYARLADYPQDKLSKYFAGEIDWIPAWGPYIGWSPSEEGAYNGISGRLSDYFFAAKDVREEVDRNYGRGKPKLMGQPAGPNWVIQPEWLEISMDCYFFNQWEAICPWIFPQGADARHWAAFGRAVTRAAKYEDAVFDGARNDAATTLAYKPGFEAKCAWPDKTFLPNVKDVPLIQQTTYDHKGVRYIAVFNLNENRHAEFTLRTKGLSGSSRVFDENGNALFGGKSFTGAELAERGVDLSVDVSRCAVFELRPLPQ